MLDRVVECVWGALKEETVESSTLPENGNNPISWLTQNEVGNKGEQPIALHSMSGRITKERKREQGCGEVCSASSHT